MEDLLNFWDVVFKGCAATIMIGFMAYCIYRGHQSK